MFEKGDSNTRKLQYYAHIVANFKMFMKFTKNNYIQYLFSIHTKTLSKNNSLRRK